MLSTFPGLGLFVVVLAGGFEGRAVIRLEVLPWICSGFLAWLAYTTILGRASSCG